MKKILCLILALSTVLCFASCGKKETEKKEETEKIDLEYYVKMGKIPECDYVLGTEASEIASNEDAEQSEGFRYICTAYNNVNYYYEKESESEKITYIVSYNGAFGFTIGATNTQITTTLAKSDLNAKEEPLEEDETFFIPVNGSFTGIKYTYGEYTLCFVFNGGILCAATIY